MKDKFWRGKCVLITGHLGFLGSYLNKSLIEQGAIITGIDIKSNGDVKDYSFVAHTLNLNKIQFIFHLTAVSTVNEAFVHPLRAFSTNIMGTWNILEAARCHKGIEGIVIASSDKAYGEHKRLPYKEDYALQGRYPYEVSKSCADLLAQAYYCTYKLPVVISRCGNIYGVGDKNICRFIPKLLFHIFNDTIMQVNGSYVRDFIYIDDVVEGYMLLAQNLKKLKLCGQVFNFGNDKPKTIEEVVNLVYKLSDKKRKYVLYKSGFPEIKSQYLSSCKARTILGWKPKITLDEGLRRTIARYATQA